MTREQLANGAATLPLAERLALAIDLWSSIEPATVSVDELPPSAPQREELDRRIAADEADDSPAEPWDDVRARLLRKEL
jgi:putative addiction module component (TIGR02574 family)